MHCFLIHLLPEKKKCDSYSPIVQSNKNCILKSLIILILYLIIVISFFHKPGNNYCELSNWVFKELNWTKIP